MSRKKIIIFSTAYLPLVGGAELAVKNLTDRLLDYDFDLITARIDISLPSSEIMGRVRVYRVGVGSRFDKILLPILGPLKALGLNYRNHYEIIWAIMASYGGLAAVFFKLLKPRKNFFLTLQEGDDFSYIMKRVGHFKFLFKQIFLRADHIQAISYYLANWAKNFGVKRPISIIPNGVDLDIFNHEWSPDNLNKSIIITVSRLEVKNGVADLIRAIKDIRGELWIIGCGSLSNELRELAKELKIEDRVNFLDNQNPDEVARLLAAASIFVRPSLSEGLGNAFLEAMAIGMPTIGTPVGGIVDFLREDDTGWLCEAGNPTDIAKKINYVLDQNNRSRVLEVAKVGQQLVRENYNWRKISNDFNVLIKGLSKPRILVSTGIYPPDIGGPSFYAESLVKEFCQLGHQVKVQSYKIEKKLPIGVRHLWFFIRLLPKLIDSDLVIALDTFSVGLPTVVGCKLLRKKIIIRTGGDFLWESYVERTGQLLLLRNFYISKNILSFKEKIIFLLTRWILRNADKIIFSTDWQRRIWMKPYNLDLSKTEVVENYYGQVQAGNQSPQKNFFWAGRILRWKNLDNLKEAFAMAKSRLGGIDLEVATDLKHQSMLEKIRNSYAPILVSLGDISPNTILEAIEAGKPFICTEENGLMNRIDGLGIFVDPLDKNNIVEAIIKISNKDIYEKLARNIREFKFAHSYGDIAREILAIGDKITTTR